MKGKVGLYHCNYCDKDISETIRIRCATCSDFDLCVECFSVGAELTPHRSSHLYRVMDNLSFPLLSPDWSAEEEVMLLEGVEMYGLSNWKDVGGHIGTKSSAQCTDHYNEIYMCSPSFPLPDMSCVRGKSKVDLLALAAGQRTTNLNPSQSLGEGEQVPVLLSRVDDPSHPSSPSAFVAGAAEGSLGEERYNSSSREEEVGLAQIGVRGYDPKRGEFEIEYDNDAELLLVDMEFKDADTDMERDLKLRLLRIYSCRLDERMRRKDLVLERKLLPVLPLPSSEEQRVCDLYKVFLRFSRTNESHERLLSSIIEERRLCKKIKLLQKMRESGRSRISSDEEHASHEDWDISGLLGFDMLSENERALCREIRVLPVHFMKMVSVMEKEWGRGRLVVKADAHVLFDMDPIKIDRVFEHISDTAIRQKPP